MLVEGIGLKLKIPKSFLLGENQYLKSGKNMIGQYDNSYCIFGTRFGWHAMVDSNLIHSPTIFFLSILATSLISTMPLC